MKKIITILLSAGLIMGIAFYFISGNPFAQESTNGKDWSKAWVSGDGGWSSTTASGQTTSFTVDAKNRSANYILLNIEIANGKLTTEDGIELCDRTGSYGTCKKLITAGTKTNYVFTAGKNRSITGYSVQSAYYR